MTPNDKIHALIPIFGWSWWQIFLLTLIADWGIFHILNRLDPPRRKTTHWWTNVYGDVFLPIGIASAAVILRDFNHSRGWYASLWWNWLVLGAGVLVIFLVEFVLVYKVQSRKSAHQELAPSNLWHAAIFVPMFYLSVITLIPAAMTRTPEWAFSLAVVGYGGWLASLVHDTIWPPETKPVSLIQWLKHIIESS
jgi:tellurite resistance protein TehA-like permease